MRSRYLNVRIDLDRVRASAEKIRARTGVRLIAVIKADAYGLGAVRVTEALTGVADDFGYFSIHEAREVGRPGIVFGPPDGEAADYEALKLRPAVSNREQAERYQKLRPLLNVDTGMQRFGCRPQEVDDLLAHCRIEEAFTHTDQPDGAAVLRAVCGGRVPVIHAANTGLLDYPDTWLDAVRPGLGLYEGAVRVTTTLAAVRDTSGPIGYTGFSAPRVGVILAGYSHQLRPGPVLINGRRQRILECGMNTSYVSVDRTDREGDEAVLLGNELTEAELAAQLDMRPHEVLCRFTSLGQRSYVSGG
jgi:alanine racemase